MKTVILGVRAIEEVTADILRHANAEADVTPRIDFETHEALWSLLNEKRWDILKAMAGAGPLSIREVARRVERDVKAVHGDVTALIQSGVVDRHEGGVVFPYDTIHVDYTLHAAA